MARQVTGVTLAVATGGMAVAVRITMAAIGRTADMGIVVATGSDSESGMDILTPVITDRLILITIRTTTILMPMIRITTVTPTLMDTTRGWLRREL